MTFHDDLQDQRAQVSQATKDAAKAWADAMRAHVLAPPDTGFAGRLRDLAEAAKREAEAWTAAHALGITWPAMPGAESAQPPYELRSGTGRRGPADVWTRFDLAVQALNRAIGTTDAKEVADSFTEVSHLASRLADAVAREDEAAAGRPTSSGGRRRARGAA